MNRNSLDCTICGQSYTEAFDYHPCNRKEPEEIERLLGLLRESRESVRKHLHKHQRGLQAAIRRDALDVVAIETKRNGELADLLARIDAALGAFAVVENPMVPPDRIEFRDADGKVLAAVPVGAAP